ncbi:MAG: MgtC/SapB family protein [Planctomycetes bacterium]|nr:MgtC/SapB family protein [Planctomycetota bacterium]
MDATTPSIAIDPDLVLTRFGAAFALSIVFGVVRQKLGKHVGFGTFTFVALGACGLSLTAMTLNAESPLPLLSSIVTGIGFLGAGALFRASDRIVGFTSAATIWIFAVFGLTIGVGEYLLAGLVYGGIWCVILIDLAMERSDFGQAQRRLVVTVPHDVDDARLRDDLGLPPRAEAQSLRLDPDAGTLELTYALRRARSDERLLVERLLASDLVKGIEFD